MLLRALFALMLMTASALAAPCTTGQTTCTTDTVADTAIVNSINDPVMQQRVFQAWLNNCFTNVWSKALGSQSSANSLLQYSYCNQVATGSIDKKTLVALIMNSITEPEILSASCSLPAGVSTAQGCLVDVDLQNSISALMAVTVSSAATTATQATVGATTIVVASATGIAAGMNVYGAGIPAGAIVPPGGVSGTNVTISAPTTAALAATPVLFTVTTGLP